MIPTKIIIQSDKNELKFVGEKKGIFTYEYVKSKTKKGMLLELNEQDLLKLISTNEK